MRPHFAQGPVRARRAQELQCVQPSLVGDPGACLPFSWLSVLGGRGPAARPRLRCSVRRGKGPRRTRFRPLLVFVFVCLARVRLIQRNAAFREALHIHDDGSRYARLPSRLFWRASPHWLVAASRTRARSWTKCWLWICRCSCPRWKRSAISPRCCSFGRSTSSRGVMLIDADVR